MIRNIQRILLYAAAALTAVSCIVDKTEHDAMPDQKTNTVRFTLSVPGVATPQPSSRSLTPAQEEAVSTVDVLVFYTSGDHSGKLYRRKKATLVSGTTFEVELPEGTYDLAVFGNATSLIDGTTGLIPQTVTKTDAIASLISANAGGYWTDATIPMWGYADGVVVDETTSLTGSDAIDMHRMTAKIEVQLAAAAAGADNANFALTSVRLYNYNTKGRLAPDMANWNPTGGVVNAGKGIATAPTIPADRGAVTGVNNPLVFEAAQGVTANDLLNTIYTFEAAKGTALTLEDNPCLVIGGSYQGETPTYYRVDFVQKSGENVTYLNLLRNHRYLISVNSVTGKGHETPEEAFNSRSFNIEVKILQWEDGGMTNVVFDDQNYLSVDPGEFSLSREAKTGNSFGVKTDVASGWTVTGVTNTATGGGTATWVKNIAGSFTAVNTRDAVTFDVEENDTGSARTAYIQVKAGRLEFAVAVTQGIMDDVRIWILNENGNNEISELVFSSAAGVQPAEQKFRVQWTPASAAVSVGSAPAVSGGTAFTYGSGDSPGVGITSLNDGSGDALFTIRPTALTQNEIDTNPFFEKASKVDFVIPFGGIYVSQSIFLRQINYNLVTDVAADYMLVSQTETIKVRANFAWEISAITDTDDILQNESALIGMKGGNNITTGNAVSFTMAAETANGSKEGKTATITFRNIQNGLTWNVTITATELSYVGYFGGELVDKGGYWQYEHKLYIQRNDEKDGSETTFKWSTNNTVLQGVTDLINGRNNTYELHNSITYINTAATQCYNKNKGAISSASDLVWYLPSSTQMIAVWVSQNGYPAASQLVGGYQTSTENQDWASYTISFTNGRMLNESKAAARRVRCVREYTGQ